MLQLKINKSYYFLNLISGVNPHLDEIRESVSQSTLGSPSLPVLLHFLVFIKREADESLQIRMGALCLKLHTNKWICSPSRQPLIVFHRGKMQFVSFLCRTSKGSGPRVMTHCTENALFPIEENQICTLFVHFFYISICVIRLWAVTVNGWISRGKKHGPSVGG